MKQDTTASILILLFISPLAFTAPDGFRTRLKHVDSDGNFTAIELFHRAVERSRGRLQAMNDRLSNGTINVEGPLYSGFPEYMFELSIGTPPQPITGIMDTGSDLIWTQCQPCDNCVDQTDPLYSPYLSSTYTPVPCTDSICLLLNSTCTTYLGCEYYYAYGTGSTYGILGVETFIFGDEMVRVSSVVFGCSEVTNVDLMNSSGIIGFSPGPFSIVSQFNSPRFSYCLDFMTTESSASTLFVGSSATINSPSVQSTPIMNFGIPYPPYYSVNLTGISLGGTHLPIPENVFKYVDGDMRTGTIIDSGTVVTHLAEKAYFIVRKAVRSRVNLPFLTGILDLCFDISEAPAPSMPDMIFHFDGADMVVPYMFTFSDVSAFCLMMFPNSGMPSVVGNFQQQDKIIMYDLATQRLSFAPARCQEL